MTLVLADARGAERTGHHNMSVGWNLRSRWLNFKNIINFMARLVAQRFHREQNIFTRNFVVVLNFQPNFRVLTDQSARNEEFIIVDAEHSFGVLQKWLNSVEQGSIEV